MEKGFTTEDYNYHLPEEKIAKFPLEIRSDSKLLVYNKGEIKSDTFKSIIHYLPKDSFLLFNDTKVIEARLHFYKQTGAKIEVFLLNPVFPTSEVASAMEARQSCQWKCTIGNKKKWKGDSELQMTIKEGVESFILKAKLVENDLVQFDWNSTHTFSEVIHFAGKIPIPPYLHRESNESDSERYQTVYSNYKGAVAAPTAGLHFTEDIINKLPDKNFKTGFATLHVSAGTFKPIQADDFRDHEMHTEQISISIDTIEKLIESENIICVGTTSLRILESLYWMGVKVLLDLDDPFSITKEYPYENRTDNLPTAKEPLKVIVDYAIKNNLKYIQGQTQIFIYPGYKFQLCSGLITNFHLPKSTLLLLISSFIGGQWKNVYDFALSKNYRFLSYGDSSLLIP